MTTAARPTSEQSCHWYSKDGTPVYEVPRATGEGMRPTTLADARKLNLLPSVTTILQVLAKPQLTNWLIEQSLLAALTTPKPATESLDAFIQRVIHVEKVQDQESDIAKKRGIEIHGALEAWAKGEPVMALRPWIAPVIEFLRAFGPVASAETILVGDGYAGRTDLIQRFDGGTRIWDFKTTKKLPKGDAWTEHRLQLSAYANAFHDPDNEQEDTITTGNIYISSVEPGKFVVCEHEENWYSVYKDGFAPLLHHWQWANNYHP